MKKISRIWLIRRLCQKHYKSVRPTAQQINNVIHKYGLNKYSLDSILIPNNLQPRAALGFSLIPILFLLNKLDFIDSNILDFSSSVEAFF